ncbi:pyruvate dehydrogenase E2 component (dihydrolipoamide acetyltransferase) [Quadrisphaera granulorum]|uniref:Dihydrolipoamide acetyltransferase component of pyruvate dehydrogenase complex n=1 Tax=Quadrisphaera granulorum TaxID=317664 RepID=A0A316AFR3_9ACTN|nr:dihydrolipoamide acetyltransferase family protein [Quadrisphaera granulorum]PWJ55820.1 pyruvate dehydrogenase E2 component (dihydrolipoamide acetyltransferase) [Quadrisphaera granulorum]SZE95317.1 pyruvate dehydrogenase E2 component (dihydrolipoamide acetyltransferase) [Quadrisphaera granulorum]
MTTQTTTPTSTQTSTTSTQHFLLPDVGEGLTEADVVRWTVAVGDTVTDGDTVVEVETAKSLVELPIPFTGTVVGLLVPEGTTVAVGTPIIAVETAAPGGSAAPEAPRDHPHRPAPVAPTGQGGSGLEGGPVSAVEHEHEVEREAVLVGYGVRPATHGHPARRRRTVRRQAPVGAGASVPVSRRPQQDGTDRPLASPPVRAMARDLGVDLASVVATGDGGVVTRDDVRAFVDARGAAPEAPPGQRDVVVELPTEGVVADGRETRIPVRGVRRATARQMVASAFTAPHATAFVTVDVTRSMKMLERIRAEREFRDVHVSPLLLVARAVCLAAARHPGINASWDELAQEIVIKHYVNLGIAVASPRGLLVPSIKDAHDMSLVQLAHALGDLVSTARAGRSQPADLSGSTLSITNIGVFGVDSGTPILNPGEAAILCVGQVAKKPWVHKGKVKPRDVVELSVSFDHRLVDGDLGSKFLADVARVLERPDTALRWA